jgi:DNA-binding NarL/FixJ family response regulator
MTLQEMRELAMLRALAKFKTVKEAAKVLGIAERTLAAFKANISNKEPQQKENGR